MLELARAVLSDIRHGKNIEAYVLFILGVILGILGLANLASAQVVSSGVLLSVSYLIFHSTGAGESEANVAVRVSGREDFGPFIDLLTDTRELFVYAPTGVNLVSHSGEIRRRVLDRGGSVKFLLQDPESLDVDRLERVLDPTSDFRSALSNSIATLRRLDSHPNLECHFSDVSPGFSFVAIDPHSVDGRVIVEFHGFQDDSISDRMHLSISRSDSPRWFEYWLDCFERMWSASRPAFVEQPDVPS